MALRSRLSVDALDLANQRLLHLARHPVALGHAVDMTGAQAEFPGHRGAEPLVGQGPPKLGPRRVTFARTVFAVHLRKDISEEIIAVKEKLRAETKTAKPEWASKIEGLQKRVSRNQLAFAQLLGIAQSAVSAWMSGRKEPAPETYIQLGRLAGHPDCWWFWERAGLNKSDVARALPELEESLYTRADVPVVVEPAPGGMKKKPDAVAIPLLRDAAAAGGGRLIQERDVEDTLIVPRRMVKHPGATTCVRVSGRSMYPVLDDGYIVAIDTAQRDPDRLVEKMVAAQHRDEGVTIKWLRRVSGEWILLPQHTSPDYPLIVISPASGWRIIGRVIWWLAEAP